MTIAARIRAGVERRVRRLQRRIGVIFPLIGKQRAGNQKKDGQTNGDSRDFAGLAHWFLGFALATAAASVIHHVAQA
jgi:hypothetical protein